MRHAVRTQTCSVSDLIFTRRVSPSVAGVALDVKSFQRVPVCVCVCSDRLSSPPLLSVCLSVYNNSDLPISLSLSLSSGSDFAFSLTSFSSAFRSF